MVDLASEARSKRSRAGSAPGRVVRLLGAAAGGFAVALMSGSPGVAGPPSIACGTILTADVTLRADLTCDGDALVVGAAGITVNLGGHTIRGAGTGTGIRVDGAATVEIRNGTIAGFAEGVAVVDAPDTTLARLTLRGGIGVRAQVSSDVRLVASTLVDTRIDAEDSPRLAITRSVANRTRVVFASDSFDSSITRSLLIDSGISVSQSNSVSIADNVLRRASVSIRVSSGVVVQRNTISGASGGVSIGTTADNSRVLDNTFVHNEIGVLMTATFVDEADGTVIAGNTFLRNAAAGVLLEMTSVQGTPTVTIEANQFVRNGFDPGGRTDSLGRAVADGLHISAPAGSGIVVADNDARRNARYGIFAEPGTVVDGGGNTSAGDPLGCLGVVCA